MKATIRHRPVNTPEIGYIFTRKCHSLLPGARGCGVRVGQGRTVNGRFNIIFLKNVSKSPALFSLLLLLLRLLFVTEEVLLAHAIIGRTQRARNSKLAKFETVQCQLIPPAGIPECSECHSEDSLRFLEDLLRCYFTGFCYWISLRIISHAVNILPHSAGCFRTFLGFLGFYLILPFFFWGNSLNVSGVFVIYSATHLSWLKLDLTG